MTNWHPSSNLNLFYQENNSKTLTRWVRPVKWPGVWRDLRTPAEKKKKKWVATVHLSCQSFNLILYVRKTKTRKIFLIACSRSKSWKSQDFKPYWNPYFILLTTLFYDNAKCFWILGFFFFFFHVRCSINTQIGSGIVESNLGILCNWKVNFILLQISLWTMKRSKLLVSN